MPKKQYNIKCESILHPSESNENDSSNGMFSICLKIILILLNLLFPCSNTIDYCLWLVVVLILLYKYNDSLIIVIKTFNSIINELTN